MEPHLERFQLTSIGSDIRGSFFGFCPAITASLALNAISSPSHSRARAVPIKWEVAHGHRRAYSAANADCVTRSTLILSACSMALTIS